MNVRLRRGGFETLPYKKILGVLGVLAVILIAFFLRFHNLGAQSFWNDEGSSYVQATRSFADIAANAARDIHPPGYYWLLAIWRQFSGDSEFGLRALSAFASLMTVAFTYALGKRLFNPAAGLAAALFVALNTFSIYYAQEARMYALLALWGVMGMWALVGLLSPPPNPLSAKRGGGIRWALTLALINAAGLYTQYAYPFVMLAQGVIFLVWLMGKLFGERTRRASSLQRLGWYVGANVLTILLYLPWIPTALHQLTTWPSTGQPIPAGEALGTIVGWFLFGLNYNPYLGDGTAFMLVFILAIILLGGGLGKWNHQRVFWRVSLPILWVLIPVGLFLALGLFRPVNLKFLLPSQIGFALFMGLGLARFWEGFKNWGFGGTLMATPSTTKSSLFLSRLFAALISLFLILAFGGVLSRLYTDPAYQRPNYREMVRQITADPRPGDAIILDAPNQEEVFRYYYKGDAPIYPLPPGLGGNDTETAALTQDIIDHNQRIFVLFWGEAERDREHIVEHLLDTKTFQAGIDQWFGDVRFVQYVTPADMPDLTPSGARFGDHISLDSFALSATTLTAGDVLQVRLDWQTDAPLDTAYKVFVQLLNSDGQLVAQQDSEPNSGTSPTTSWTPGQTVIDRHGLAIPRDLPPGTYKLIIGLYNRDDSSARLPIAGGDYLELGQISVKN